MYISLLHEQVMSPRPTRHNTLRDGQCKQKKNKNMSSSYATRGVCPRTGTQVEGNVQYIMYYKPLEQGTKP